jgi:hypothetical protein
MDLALGGLYSEAAVKAGIDTATADLIFASLPYRALPPLQVPVYQQMKERDAEFYSRLEKAGFQLDFGDDESGLFMKYLRRGSGYYIDVGASELVANGSVKLKNGAIERVTDSGLAMLDGSELKADLIVWATGYGSMNGWVAQLIDQPTADKVGKCWGLGSHQQRRSVGRRTAQHVEATQVPNLWMQGGNLHQNRHYSLCLAFATEGPHGGHPDAGVRSRRCTTELRADAADRIPAPVRRWTAAPDEKRRAWRIVGIAVAVLIAVLAVATPWCSRCRLRRRTHGGASPARGRTPSIATAVSSTAAAGVYLGRRTSAVRRPVLRRRSARTAGRDSGAADRSKPVAAEPGLRARSGSATRAFAQIDGVSC